MEKDMAKRIMVGPFYYLENGTLDYQLEFIDDIEPIEGKYDSSTGHYQLTQLRFRKAYAWYKDHAYDYYPRGRLVYDAVKKQILIYTNKCIRTNPEISSLVVKELIPAGVHYAWRSDAHYRCHHCNPHFLDDEEDVC